MYEQLSFHCASAAQAVIIVLMIRRKGFALPTVLITSVVMMIVLLAALTSVTASTSSLRSQYHVKLAESAAESGIAMAKACLEKVNYGTTGQLWTSPLRPNTDCSGNQVNANCTQSAAVLNHCGVIESDKIRTTFEVPVPSGSGFDKNIQSTGIIQQTRPSTNTRATTHIAVRKSAVTLRNSPEASKANQRFWYFGDRAGLDFNSSSPTAIPSPVEVKCAAAPCIAGEGSTVISDKSGRLQFWSDGQTIWNREGGVMQNAGGLSGGYSTTQAAAVFPLGADEKKYVVVTNNAINVESGPGELYYSIIDMTLDGGLGAVTSTKNEAVWSGHTDYSSEALTAAPKPDGSGYWIVTYTPYSLTLRVFSFDLTDSGISISASSHTSTPPSGQTITSNSSAIGFGTLNFNSDYSKLVMMAGDHCVNSSSSCTSISGALWLMQFNAANGTIANISMWNNQNLNGRGYSADFSPSDKYIYTSTLYPSRIVRYRIDGANTPNTYQYVGDADYTEGVKNSGGQVRRAPDGRMYVAARMESAISVINNPDADQSNPFLVQGSVGWSKYGLSLYDGTYSAVSMYGLPQMVTVFVPESIQY